jgi:hypothetical protein
MVLDRIPVTSGVLRNALSIGREIRVSTSCAASPGFSVITEIIGELRSGRNSVEVLKTEVTPKKIARQINSITRSRCSRQYFMIRESISSAL